MTSSEHLFDTCGGYRKLHSFTFATLIHLATIDFCKRFIPWQEDALGKTSGQMIGAARSGRQNIIEASERSSTSKETEIKLTDVARASLAELLGDFEIHLASKGAIPWSKNEPDRVNVGAIRLPGFEHTDDSLHDYWVYFHHVRPLFEYWLDNENDIVVANTILIMIKKTMTMLQKQIRSQRKSFLETGGFRERMSTCRKEVRNQAADTGSPHCPKCNKPMVERKAHKGTHQGESFWGCCDYPNCNGTRKVEA